jgi:hypothetical protein
VVFHPVVDVISVDMENAIGLGMAGRSFTTPTIIFTAKSHYC